MPVAPVTIPYVFSAAPAPLSGTLGITDKYLLNNSITLGQFQDTTLVTIKITGITRVIWNYPIARRGQLEMNLDARGRFMGGVYNSCYEGVAIYKPNGVGFGACWTATQPYTAAPELSVMTLAIGTVTARWNGARPEDYWGAPLRYYEGDKTIDVTPVAASLSLTASALAITRGSAASVTAMITPDSAGGLRVPFSIQSWRWIPDSGAYTLPCAGGSATGKAICSFTPLSSGTMRVEAKVNGSAESRAIRISVVPCLTGDSLLDDSRIRRALLDAMAASNPNANAWDRRERAGVRFLRPDGSIADTLLPPGSNNSPCATSALAAALPTGSTRLLIWHTHPFAPAPANDPLPYNSSVVPPSNCAGLDTLPPPPPGTWYGSAPRPSAEDLRAGQGMVPHIVVDKTNVYLIPVDYPNRPYLTFPRSGSGVCDPLSL